jgi:4-hydroxy-3-methylbut-2-enyl diphosphate reductase
MTDLELFLAAPRGSCAGVDRAVETVERALELQGAPVYVRKQIVHNIHVVRDLETRGAIFVDDVSEIPEGATVVFSAHGVAPTVHADAQVRGLDVVDATCPLVTKVHREAEVHHKRGRLVILIGHEGHPEVIGTMGQLPDGAVLLVETPDDVAKLQVPADRELAFATQTTLSVDDTVEMVEALKARFPAIHGPHKEDICYATTNRQEAVKAVAPKVEAMLVVGSPNSSNSQRLREVAETEGCRVARLILRADEIPWHDLQGISRIGLTAGASAPEILIDEIVEALRARFDLTIETVTIADETMFFPLPRELRESV